MKNLLSFREIKIDETLQGELTIPVYEFISSIEGKTVYIQSSVHGAELQGNAVIIKMIEYIKNANFKGKIIFVPLANPYASSSKLGTYTYGRFNPTTGDNWNRMYLDFDKLSVGSGGIDFDEFISSAQELEQEEITKKFKKFIRKSLNEYVKANQAYGVNENKALFVKLQELASEADIVLDLHTGANASRYIYGPEYLEDTMSDLNFPYYIIIPNEFGGAMDEATFVPWVNLEKKLSKKGIKFKNNFESFTVELGSEEIINMNAAQTDASNLLNYLYKRGVLEDEVKIETTKQHFCKLSDYKTYFAPCAGLCEYNVSPGESFKKGDTLYTIYQMKNLSAEESEYKLEVKALTDGIMIHQNPSASIKKGMDLIQVFSKPY